MILRNPNLDLARKDVASCMYHKKKKVLTSIEILRIWN
jgi:hypothetical protein